jgi:hypothetical protein
MSAGTGATGTASGENDLISVEWTVRMEPLVPHAVVARGAAAIDLGKRILARPPKTIERLRCVVAESFVIVLGDADDLPWTDGALYLGRVGTCTMYLPTLLQPSVHPLLLERALLKANRSLRAPFAVLAQDSLVVPLANAQTVQRDFISSWLEAP